MRRTWRVCFALATAGWLLSLVVWRAVPDPMAIHWDVYGRPDGFAPRWLGLTFLPALGLGLSALTTALARRTEPRPSERQLGFILVGLSAFHVAVHAVMVKAALSPDMDLSMGLLFALVGALFVALGWVMPKLSPNRLMGIRTPWALADEVNWHITHRFARWTMMAAGALSALAGLVIAPPALAWVVIALIAAGTLSPVVLSYAIHRTRS